MFQMMLVFLRTFTLFVISMLFFSFCSSTPQGFIILCAGDSLTAADYPRFLQRRFNHDGILAKVLNYGRNGNTSGEYLAFLRENAARLSEEHPDFILIQLGTNDIREDLDFTSTAQFSENIKDIIDIFRSFRTRTGQTPQCLIATIPPIPENYSYPFTGDSQRRVREDINPAIKKIASTKGLILVDNYTILFNEPLLLPDVHPSKDGYKQIAQNWYNSLNPLIE